MKHDYDYEIDYFAEELLEVTPRIIPSCYGNIYSNTAGTIGQPLILVVHGSGPKNSCDQYSFLLQEYLVRISYCQKYYIVAIDCPGYGRSVGSKEAVKTFPLNLFREILKGLSYKNYFAMFGHSQGGAAIFNAVHEDPTITEFLVMDRPVCGNIQRFRGFSMPTLLIYDIQDDGHPIWQGKLLYKELKNTEFYTYRSSNQPYWVPDNIWNKMLGFFSKSKNIKRKSHFEDMVERKKNKSESKRQKASIEREWIKMNNYLSADKAGQIKKIEQQKMKLVQIQQKQYSQLLSVSSKDQVGELFQQQIVEVAKEQIIKTQKQQKQKVELQQQQQRQKVELKQQNVEIVKNQVSKMTKQQLLNDNKCAICYQTLFRPTITNCNHQFCTKCLLQALLINNKCPLCRAKITNKSQNIQLHQTLLKQLSAKDIIRRQNELKHIENMLKSVVYIQIGNNSKELPTKQSIFSKIQKKYIWQLYVKQPKNFCLEEVWFNINMGEVTSKPVRIKNAPFTFESRGTFSFACEITIRPRNKEYADLTTVYRIDVSPGNHFQRIALKKKIYSK